MTNRWLGVGLVGVGVVAGVAVAGLRPETVVSAQTGWVCRSWTLESGEGVGALAPFLGASPRVELTAAGLDIAGRYVLVACRQ
jgi:hypothetical protein